MKKILTLLILTISLSGTSQEWRMFGTPGQLPVAIDHAFTVRENNRPAVAYILSSQDLGSSRMEWCRMDNA
jgi:hypothetical protein